MFVHIISFSLNFFQFKKGSLAGSLSFLLLILLLQSCASVSKLPESAQQVEFSDHIAGVPSTREYDQCHYYAGVNLTSVLQAAKYSLIKNKFSIRKENLSAGVVTAEHGMTSRDWNIISGIYFSEISKDKVAVKFIVKMAASTSLYQQDLLTAKQWTSKLVDEFNNNIQLDPAAGISIMNCR